MRWPAAFGGPILALACAWAWLGLWACAGETAGPNRAPVAVAGPDRQALVEQTIALSCAASYDPDGDELTCNWTVLGLPPGGDPQRLAVADRAASLRPDVPGHWVIGLRVFDGKIWSAADVLRVRVEIGCQEGTSCDDGQACTTGDMCVDGECRGVLIDGDGDGYSPETCGGLDCDDDDAATHPGALESPAGDPVCSDGRDNDCDARTDGDDVGCRVCAANAECDDDNPCTVDHCSASTCSNTPLPAGQDCGLCRACSPEGLCVDDLDQHADCGPCRECAFGGQCADQPVGADRKGDCPAMTCHPGGCDGAGACSLDSPDTPCSDGDASDCRLAGCDEAGACIQGRLLADESVVCRPASQACDAVERCDGTSPECPQDAELADGSPCPGGTCCAGACQAGVECCADADCEDSNRCTEDSCVAGTCEHPCPQADCLLLSVDQPVGGAAAVTVHSCDPAIDQTALACRSSRNLGTVLFAEDFEGTLDGFTSTNLATLGTSSQNPRSAGVQGAHLCEEGALLEVAISTAGFQEVGLGFAVRVDPSDPLDNNQMLQVDFMDGQGWTAIFLVGDQRDEPWDDHLLILPARAANNDFFRFSFSLRGGGANHDDCVDVDDIVLWGMPARSSGLQLLTADFGDMAGTGCAAAPFTVVDPQGDDVWLESVEGSCRVRIEDHQGARISSPAIDTSGVQADELLLVRWLWKEYFPLDVGEYALLEFSADGGTTWAPLALTGHGYAPGTFDRDSAVLPCEATGVNTLRLRFVSPGLSGSPNAEGFMVDNVSLTAVPTDRIDAFGPFAEQAPGLLMGTVSGPSGQTIISCRLGCGADERWTDSVDLSFP